MTFPARITTVVGLLVSSAAALGPGVADAVPGAIPIVCAGTVTDGPDIVVAYACDRARGAGDDTVTTPSATYHCAGSVNFFVDPFREFRAQGVDPGHTFLGGRCTRT